MFVTPKALVTLTQGMRFVMVAAPRETVLLIIINFFSGAGPTLLLIVSRYIIDTISVRSTGATSLYSSSVGRNLLTAVVVFIVLNFVLDSVQTVASIALDNLRDRVRGAARKQILTKVSSFEDISLFERPDLLNVIHLAEGSVDKLWGLGGAVAGTVTGAFAFLPALLLSGELAWWVPCVLFFTAIPAIIVQGRIEERSWSVETGQAGASRQMKLYQSLLTSELYAKEIRLYGLKDRFLSQWQTLFSAMFTQMQRVRSQGAGLAIFWSALSALGAGLPLLYVVDAALRNVYTLGDVALFTGLIFQVRRSLILLIYEGGQIYESTLGIQPIFDLLKLEAAISHASSQVIQNKNVVTHGGIRFEHVQFTYPGSMQATLTNIDFEIRPGEMVVLVGENGAGKSTLSKLLGRLYEPTFGRILWNGEDVQSISVNIYRKRLAVVTQDFAHFPVTARENIAFGDLLKINESEAILQAAAQARIADEICGLSSGLDTTLGKLVAGGVDLSGGQWQRIALSRAFLRQQEAELIILDEPTAALDPRSEFEMFATFRDLVRGKMSLIISHRLALAKNADRIIVLEHGHIIEVGTHGELIALGGKYFDMFSKQASSYI